MKLENTPTSLKQNYLLFYLVKKNRPLRFEGNMSGSHICGAWIWVQKVPTENNKKCKLNYKTLVTLKKKKKPLANAKLNGLLVNFMVTYKEEVN